MHYLERVERASREEIRAGRIGKPVFARLFLELSADHGTLLDVLARGTALLASLLDQRVESVFVTGRVEAGHLSAQSVFAAGGTGLVTVNLLRHSAPNVDLFVLGNHGSIRHAPRRELLESDGECGTEFSDWQESASQTFASAMKESLAKERVVRVPPNSGGSPR